MGKGSNAREKSYGGASGIFVRRKRRSSEPILSIAREGSDPQKPSSSFGKKLFSGVRPILWDEEKCRPIFPQQSSDGAKGSSDGGRTSDTDFSDEDEAESTNEDSTESTGNQMTTSRSSEGNMRWMIESERTRVRSYGRKRPSPVTSDNDFSARAETIKVETGRGRAKARRLMRRSKACLLTSPVTGNGFKLSSPYQKQSTICTALDSAIKAREVNQRKSSSMSTFPSRKKESAMGVIKKEPLARPHGEGSKGPANDSMDFVSEQASQPASKTPLENIKAFFERLDTSEPLTIASPSEPTPERRLCVRTRRKPILSGQLMKEYGEYSRASRQTGISPISVQEYAKHRVDFFRTHDIFDGFLDT